jgi:predicted  nucleic acid-binding Zn-ribbon protein
VAEPVPAGSDVSSGTYECTNCGYDLEVGSTTHLPPCPECGNGSWNTKSGGDSKDGSVPRRVRRRVPGAPVPGTHRPRKPRTAIAERRASIARAESPG